MKSIHSRYLAGLAVVSFLLAALRAVHANTYQIDGGTAEFGVGNG
jgi:hypothetical protein